MEFFTETRTSDPVEHSPFHAELFDSKTLAASLDKQGQQETKDQKEQQEAAAKEIEEKLDIEYVPVGRHTVISSITLPDGGKMKRVTEPLPGRDGDSGSRVLKGYSLPNGTLLEKTITRNGDGTMTVQDLNNDGSKTDRHPQRMTDAEFIKYIKEQQKN